MVKHKLDKLFSEGLESFESVPSNNAWKEIEGQLNQKKSKSYWAWASIAASAALLLASSWLLLRNTEETQITTYNYASKEMGSPTLPAEIVYVPIYIPTIVERPVKVKYTQPTNSSKSKETEITQEKEVLLASVEEINAEQPEVIALEDVPVVVGEITVATADLPIEKEPTQLQPVTIIYKQGEPAKESNFTKAINYMEDVRLGEKRLVNFDKLKENFRSKFRSEAETD